MVERAGPPSGTYGTEVVMSADGSKILTAGQSSAMYSSDGGSTWSTFNLPASPYSVAASPDLTQIAISTDGPIFVSNNSGVSWVESSSPSGLGHLQISADGTKVIANTLVYLNSSFYAASSVTTLGSTGAIFGSQYESIDLQYFGDGMFSIISGDGIFGVH